MTIIVIGPFGVRQAVLNDGEEALSHKHNFPHVTYINRGAAEFHKLEPIKFAEDGVTPLDFAVIKKAFIKASMGHNYVDIKAGVWHRIIGREDNTMYQCMFFHREVGGEIVEHYTGWEAAYL